MWLRPQVTNVRNPLQKAVSGGDPPPPGLTRGSPDSQEAHMPPPSPDPYLGQPALHGGLGAPLRHGWRPNGLDLQQALQDTDPFLQQAGRVSRQVVGLLLRDELGGEGVGRGGWKMGPAMRWHRTLAHRAFLLVFLFSISLPLHSISHPASSSFLKPTNEERRKCQCHVFHTRSSCPIFVFMGATS